MRLTLEEIESYNLSSAERIKIFHLHHAIVTEVRDNRNWNSALKLFTTYLAPIIVASQKAVAAAGGTIPAVPGSNNNRKYPPESSRMIDFDEKHNSNFKKQLNDEDIRLIQYAISAMVRYAPSVTESNILYMFYLNCQPPIRCDETIDKCLVSLIYQYANSDQEHQAKGKDLIEVALNRGIGLPDYKSVASRKQKMFGIKPKNDTGILRNVSEPILRLLNLQISSDGRSLEPYDWPPRRSRPSQHTPHHPNQPQSTQQLNQPRSSQQPSQPQPPQQQRQSRPPQQQQQHGSQQQHHGPQQQHRGPQQQSQSRQYQHQSHSQPSLPRTESSQGQNEGLGQKNVPTQASIHKSPGINEPHVGRGSLGQLSSLPQQLQEKGEPNTIAGKNINLESGTSGNPASRIPDDDQYSYYQKASRRGFEGSHRDGHRGGHSSFTGSSGGKHRKMTFVPASTNPMLKTDSPPTEDLGEVKESIQAPDTKVPATAIVDATEEALLQESQGSSLATSDVPKEEPLEEGQDMSPALAEKPPGESQSSSLATSDIPKEEHLEEGQDMSPALADKPPERQSSSLPTSDMPKEEHLEEGQDTSPALAEKLPGESQSSSLPTSDIPKEEHLEKNQDVSPALTENLPEESQGSSLAASDIPKEEHLEEEQDISSALAEKLQLEPQSCDETNAS
ncbi:hypothetical protein BGX21_000993 [Mortierella sp. AD011]|nr:hypothetical protein BGX20_001012 [Mortierella sp. AD010]KAF9385696.1 hypothetical protein BGX21_000993 [Mortierella sp. AD011]